MSGRPKRAGAGKKEKQYPGEPEPEKPVVEKKAPAKRGTAKDKKATATTTNKRATRKRKAANDSDEDELPQWTKQLVKSKEHEASLAYLVLNVVDTRKAAAVYKELFGFEQRSPDDPQTDAWLELSTGTTALAFHRVQDGKTGVGAGTAESGWFVPDIAAFHERATKVDGVKVSEAPTKQPWGGIKARYTDIDGITISVTEWNEEKVREFAAEQRKKAKEEAAAKAAAEGGDAAKKEGADDAAATVDEEDDDDDDDEPKKGRSRSAKAKSKAKAKAKKGSGKGKSKAAPKKKKAKKDESSEGGDGDDNGNDDKDKSAPAAAATSGDATAADQSE